MVKDTVALTQVFCKLPKDLKRQKVLFTGRTTFQSMPKRLNDGQIKIDAIALALIPCAGNLQHRVGNHITCGKSHHVPGNYIMWVRNCIKVGAPFHGSFLLER